jgi:DNA-binding CsgD family transcriptional regulator
MSSMRLSDAARANPNRQAAEASKRYTSRACSTTATAKRREVRLTMLSPILSDARNRCAVIGYALCWAVCIACFSGSISLNMMGPASAHGADGAPSPLFAAALITTTLGHLLWGAVLAFTRPSGQTAHVLGLSSGVAAALFILVLFLLPAHAGAGLVSVCGAIAGIALSLLDVLWLDFFGRVMPASSGALIPLAMGAGCIAALALKAIDTLATPIALAIALVAPVASAILVGKAASEKSADENAVSEKVSGRNVADGKHTGGKVIGTAPTQSTAAEEGRRPSLAEPGKFRMGMRQVAGILGRPLLSTLVLYVVFGFSLNIVGYATGESPDSGWPTTLTGVVTLCAETIALAIMARRASLGARISVGATYAIALVLFVLGVSLLPIAVQLDDPLPLYCIAAVPIGVGGTVCDALLISLAAHSSFDYRMPGGLTGGIVRGITLAVSSCGALIGNALITGGYVEQHLGVTIFAQLAILAMVTAGALFLGRRRIAVLLDNPAKPEEAQASEVLSPNPAEVGARHAAGAATGEDPLVTSHSIVLIDAGSEPDFPKWMEQEQAADENPLDRRLADLADSNSLTPREQDILALIVRGRSIPYVARELTISESTVHSYVQRLYRKFGVHDRQALIDLVEGDESAHEQ